MKSILIAILMYPMLVFAGGKHELPLSGPVDGTMEDFVKAEIAKAQNEDADVLHVTIDSTGGEIIAGLGIIDDLMDSMLPVECEVHNFALSMAAIILESACSRRMVHKTSLIMFHEASLSSGMDTNEYSAASTAEMMKGINHALSTRVATRLGLTPEQYEKKIKQHEWWISGDQAIQEKAADEIIP